MRHLSASQINTWMRCQKQWYFRYIENIVITTNFSLVRGSAYHKSLEYIYRNKMNGAEYYDDLATDIAREYVDKSGIKEKPETIDSSTKLVKIYCGSGVPETVKDEDILGVEKKVTPIIGGVQMLGYIDLLTDKVTDFKTSKRRPSKVSTDYRIQGSIYSEATGIDTLNFEYIIDKKEPEIVNLAPKRVSKTFLEKLVVNISNSIKSSKKSGIFTPNGLGHSWACNYCGYGEQGYCKYYIGS